jgi:Cation efflux family
LGERLPYKQEVAGSSPAPPTSVHAGFAAPGIVSRGRVISFVISRNDEARLVSGLRYSQGARDKTLGPGIAAGGCRVPRAQNALAPHGRRLRSRGLRLEFATLGWNVVGSVVVLGAAVAARSVALAGFGLDSLIEILASLVVVWQLQDLYAAERERRALRIIGLPFLLLAVYIAAQSAYVFATEARPNHSLLGIVWLALTAAAMFALAAGKSRTGRALGNPVLQSEARVTLIDGLLASAVLVGLVLNAAAGLWWADPAAAFVIVYYGAHEGWHALHETFD